MELLAPLLIQHYSVVAIDLSGHGDSGDASMLPRDVGRRVMAVVSPRGFVGPPILVGHSMGGLRTIVAAALYGDGLAGAIIVDAPVRIRIPRARKANAAAPSQPQDVPRCRHGALALSPRPATAVRQRFHPRLHRRTLAARTPQAG